MPSAAKKVIINSGTGWFFMGWSTSAPLTSVRHSLWCGDESEAHIFDNFDDAMAEMVYFYRPENMVIEDARHVGKILTVESLA